MSIQRSDAPLFTLRAVVVLTVAALCAGVVGALTYASTNSWPEAVLAGLVASGSAVPVLDQLIGHEGQR